MKAIKELNIKNWSGYFFEKMVNILKIDPECFMVSNAKKCTEGTMLYNLCYSDKIRVPHIVFNNMDYCFKKVMILVFNFFFADGKNKNTYDV